MQPLLIKVNVPQKASFSVNRSVFSNGFPGIWHFHDEYELTLILESSGRRMVGDHIDRFTSGDLIFIGKNLPHTWRNDELHTYDKSEVLVLHFLDDFLGNTFFGIPEMAKVSAFLERSHRGIKIIGETRDYIADQLIKMEQAAGADNIILLLSMLNTLSNSDSNDLVELSSEGFANSIDESGSNRLNKVYEYIMNNFQEGISLVKVAAVANMSPTAFSRYFKSRTRKSFSQFTIELRIGYACKLLMREDMSVTQACYESGFQNLSNFNQQFKEITRLTPKKYQLMHAAK
ncbi:AraC family transcriptional regulator [Chitinophaga sp. MM2321]|uniref:AraC family transcriptional regulator n=1 Tax=Chitinophaga sp. MM2321 TaxID=3137178 RepID=UPI0032D57C65